MENVYRLNFLMRIFSAAVGIVVLVFFIPLLVRRIRTGPVDIGMEIFAVVFIVAIVGLCILLFSYSIELKQDELVVRMIFPVGRIEIGRIGACDHAVPLLPVYLFRFERDLTGRPTSMIIFSLHNQVRFMATLSNRKRSIRFSKWNERRISRYLELHSDAII